MPNVTIDKDRCKGCELCVYACPQKVLEMSKKDLNAKGYFYSVPVRPHLCIGCTMCAIVCPDTAIKVEVYGTRYRYFAY